MAIEALFLVSLRGGAGRTGGEGRRGQERGGEGAIVLTSKTTTRTCITLFLYIFLPFLHNYDVKMPNFAYSGEGNQAKTKFYFLFELGYFNSDSGGFAYI